MGAVVSKRNSTLWNSTTESRDPIMHGVNFNDEKVLETMHKAVSEFNLNKHSDRIKPFETKLSEAALSHVLK